MKIIAFIYALVSNAAYKNIEAGFSEQEDEDNFKFFYEIERSGRTAFP